MKKLLNTIHFSRNLRKNIVLLEALLEVANNLGEVNVVNRRSREHLHQVKKRMNDMPGIISRIELYELRRQLKSLRKSIASKTVNILNTNGAVA